MHFRLLQTNTFDLKLIIVKGLLIENINFFI